MKAASNRSAAVVGRLALGTLTAKCLALVKAARICSPMSAWLRPVEGLSCTFRAAVSAALVIMTRRLWEVGWLIRLMDLTQLQHGKAAS